MEEEMETSGWSELFSDKLIILDDRLEIEGEGGRRCFTTATWFIVIIRQGSLSL